MGESQKGENRACNLFEKLKDPDYKDKILDSAPPIPDQVRKWLGRLSLLYGVPFGYLVSDEKMLEMESLRFFYVDPQWIECLVDGALSVGRSSDVRLLLGKTMAGNFLVQEVLEEAKKVRPELQRKEVQPSSAQGAWQLTGFILRSAVVAGWRGLEIKAYGKNGNEPLPILRLERISNDIMLCIFEGIMTQLVITQPPESMHFGVESSAVPLRNAGQRVIKVKELAAEIQSRIKTEVTSAEFAVEMVESPVRYTMDIKEKEQGSG